MSLKGMVFIVDDTREVRSSLTRVLTAGHDATRSFDSAGQYLREQDPAEPGCLLLDIYMPGMSGLELQRALQTSHCARPIVFLSGAVDIQASVSAMKAGAIDFLTKPVDGEQLFGAIDRALRVDAEERHTHALRWATETRFNSMTSREKQVMAYVVRGRLNKQIAAYLWITEKTVKVHRARVMEKMGVRSLAELVGCGMQIRFAIAPVLTASNGILDWQASQLLTTSSRTRYRRTESRDELNGHVAQE
jgi:FixJ family two-component response regulator